MEPRTCPAAAPADPIMSDKASRARATIFVARLEVGKKGERGGEWGGGYSPLVNVQEGKSSS